MYSDNRWNLVTAGRVYPQASEASETLVLVDVNEPFASPLVLDGIRVREINPRAASKQGDSPLVKPQAYKNRSR